MVIVRNGLLIAIAWIFSLGLVMIFNTSSAEVLDLALAKSTHQALFRQLGFGVLGILLGTGLWILGYRNLLRLSFPFLCFFSFLLLLVLIPGVGHKVNGASRWLRLGSYGIQPSEFIKFLVPAYLIQVVLENPQPLSSSVFWRTVGVVTVPLFLIFLEPDNGTVAIIGVTALTFCFISGVPTKLWLFPLLGLLLIGGVVGVNLPYVRGRIKVYLNPELDIRGKGHQAYQAKIATGSGGLWGRGPGRSLQKLSYLPEAQNDYIAAIVGEELGFMGVLGLLTCYTIVTCCGFLIAYQARDLGGFYLAAMITYLVTFQAFLNFGVVSGLLPSTGLNLPFFSQGGTSLMANIAGLCVLLQISKEAQAVSE